MENQWQRSLIASMLTATILGIGAIVIWWLLLTAVIVSLEPSGPSVSEQFVLTVYALSPALMTGASVFFSSPARSLGISCVDLLRAYWFSFAVLGVISIPLAMMCYRHHRRYGRVAAVAWSVYVLMTGVPGAIGYWLHRRWPPAVRCPRCELPSPCDREECLYCAAEFPLPTANGTEILQPHLAATVL
jgi:hypothetical protein